MHITGTDIDTHAQDAIDESIRDQMAGWIDEPLDSERWILWTRVLGERCTNYEEVTVDGDLSRLYYGTDDDGDAWAVRLKGTR